MEEDLRIVREYYDQNVQKEYDRIDNRPEFLLTCRFLDRYIKPGDRVLDVGGGPGRYSLYLAQKGCEVTLLDLSEENVRFAKAKAEEMKLPLIALCGDARKADELAPAPYDHILLMGPLYHLLKEEERVQAVESCLRVLTPGGTLFASFISMVGGLIYEMKVCPDMSASPLPIEVEFRRKLKDIEDYAGDAFTRAFFIQPKNVAPFMERFPLDKLGLIGQEGVMSPCEDNIMAQEKPVIDAWLDISEALCGREEYLTWAEHLMYIGKKRGLDPALREEIDAFRRSDYTFDGFAELPKLRDGELSLRCVGQKPAVPERKFVPGYEFEVMLDDRPVGHINLRIGFVEGLYYGGNIGYGIDEAFRGRGYAGRACRMLIPVLRAHHMKHAFITNAHDNIASKRVCEKLGARFLRVAELPEWTPLYQEGTRLENVFDWVID